MLTEKEDVFYYLTVMNENYQQPSIPKKEEEGILKGMYRIKKADINISSEKRSKYPACRPTPGACKERGKGKSWGKKAKGKNND